MKNKRENGEVVVEATLVVTLVVVFVTSMLYIGMILYQKTLVSIMANQTAANIAQVYANNLKDPFTGYIDADKVYQSITYSNMKDDAYIDVLEQKATVFAKYRLKSGRILASGITDVDVQIVKKPHEILKSQIVVTIHDQYDMPLVGMFGTNGLVDFTASGRADCVDILEYINGVEAVGDPEHSNVTFLPDSDNCTITFISNRESPVVYATVVVHKGKSILSSSRYTHSAMPKNPSDGSHEFAGWVDENNVPFIGSTIVEEDKVIYAEWKCNVTLDATGGKVQGNNTYSFKVNAGKRAYLPNATKQNYKFKGWFTERNGKGSRYISNDTVFDEDITLYAHRECSHPTRVEKSRTGTVCEGGTIYYKCGVCGADMGTGYYRGNGHSFSFRCNQKHYVNYFSGHGGGGCGSFHYRDDDYLSYNTYGLRTYHHTASKPWMYCQICKYCHKSRPYFWCGTHGGGRTPCAPSDWHQWG